MYPDMNSLHTGFYFKSVYPSSLVAYTKGDMRVIQDSWKEKRIIKE